MNDLRLNNRPQLRNPGGIGSETSGNDRGGSRQYGTGRSLRRCSTASPGSALGVGQSSSTARRSTFLRGFAAPKSQSLGGQTIQHTDITTRKTPIMKFMITWQ